MTSIKIVSTAQRLYQCREQQIFLSGEQGFIEKYEKWSPVIRLTMAKFNCNELHALVRILEITEKRHDSGMFTHLLSAVACEMCEPTITVNTNHTTEFKAGVMASRKGEKFNPDCHIEWQEGYIREQLRRVANNAQTQVRSH
ncbi:hypothetical protein AB4559_18380 [Vibrio sp. 10N.222.51.C8]|jgi:hypothetical protein|uniref:Uncharacterized protein n=3 Tax=Vibrio TaxID=662 RepID=A0A7Z1MM87_9VIBR|nr:MULTISPECIES: hypothetical protein [Vibrio]PMM20829.1 hypothetical protein BCT58_18035 [Vibrio lentus]PMP21871.1 hypothetical protein BCS91_19030 [Vibrio cyclitrophicus]PMP31575.1 hypothetical protein BCS90_11320 [Vibrio cyclitrophicus]TKG09951.1 hypothetical protein FCV67_05680 [Vibrio sp. F13]